MVALQQPSWLQYPAVGRPEAFLVRVLDSQQRAPIMVKRPAAAPGSLRHAAPGAFDATSYTKWVRRYDSRAEALEQLGSGIACKGHAARAVKKNGKVTFLQCRLRKSHPPCAWAAILREGSLGDAELYQHASLWNEHNSTSAQQGKRGFSKLEQRSALSDLLLSTATAKPSTALRSARLAGKAGKTQLRQVQCLKRQSVKSRFGIRSLGQLRAFVAKHSAVPSKLVQGFLCFSSISSPGEKLKVTVVATTRVLQARWKQGRDCVAASDGGFKFNLLGWPLHVLGHVNPAGNFALCGIALTSSMAQEHIAEMFEGFASSISKSTRCGPDAVRKALAMSDAEGAYRHGMAKAFGSANLMCYFHVKQAAKENIQKRYPGTAKEKNEVWAWLSQDIDLIHAAMTHADFLSRAEAVRAKWNAAGLAEKTSWADKKGREYNFVESFFRQWTQDVPEWYMGVAGQVMAPTTNNAAESCIRNTRNDAGNIIASVGATLDFLLQQVQAVSDNAFDPKASRQIPETLWRKAYLFSSLFGTDRIQHVKRDGRPFYCCQPRQDRQGDDVCDRPPISARRAAVMAEAYVQQLKGEETTVARLLEFNGAEGVRVFGYHNGRPFCSCPAFCNPGRLCFHTQGLAIYLGNVVLPDTLDPTLLTTAARKGNARKAPGRGAVPVLADAKDLRIADLEAQLRKLKRGRQGAMSTPASEDVPHAALVLPDSFCEKPARRLRCKTSGAQERTPDSDVTAASMGPSVLGGQQRAADSNVEPPATAAPALLLSETLVWQALEGVFHCPPDIITALFTGLSQFFTDDGAMRLFQEAWLRDLTDRWIPFAAVIHAKRPADETTPVLPSVLPEFQALLFAITRCAFGNSVVVANLPCTDEERLRTLQGQGYTHHPASGDDNNCLIHSLAICMAKAGLMDLPSEPDARRQACQIVREHLIQTPGLYPRTPQGRKCSTAYLEHGIHAEAIVRQLLGDRALPAGGFELVVHARYDDLGSPPDALFIEGPESAAGCISLDLFNFTGPGLSGFHYDALCFST